MSAPADPTWTRAFIRALRVYGATDREAYRLLGETNLAEVGDVEALARELLADLRKGRRDGLVKARKEVWRTAARSGWDARLRETWTALNDMIEEEL